MPRPTPIRISAAAALCFSLILPIASPVFAQGADADEAKRRINLAGRQRMLSQRITKAACFSLTGVNADEQLVMLSDASELFGTTHHALSAGDETLGLRHEFNPTIVDSLKAVDAKWTPFAAMAHGVVVGGMRDAENIEKLNASGLELLNDMNETVGKIAREYGNQIDELPLILSLTIDLAGRQRMLTQKISTEFCLIDAGINVEENRANLTSTLGFFNLTLTSLVGGFPGMIIPAPTDEIRASLANVESLWANANVVLTGVAEGADISDADRQIVATEVEAVLNAMNDTVALYELVVLAP